MKGGERKWKGGGGRRSSGESIRWMMRRDKVGKKEKDIGDKKN